MRANLIQVYPEYCVGCERCEMVCSFHHEGESSITKSRVRVLHDPVKLAWDHPLLCIQCAEAPCIKACPTGALYRAQVKGQMTTLSVVSGVVVVDANACTGCGDCITACPIHALYLDEEKQVIFKCDLCGDDPECVKWCDRGALVRREVDLDSPFRKAYLDESSKRLQVAG